MPTGSGAEDTEDGAREQGSPGQGARETSAPGANARGLDASEASTPPKNGMELARLFWETHRDELFAGELAPYAARAAAGLVGEGSECWGYDDEISRDHDWGPGCCIWLTRDDHATIGAELQRRYDEVAARPLAGFTPRTAQPGAGKRVGVFRVEAFYTRFLSHGMPRDLDAWRNIPEHALAAATNGAVFCDGAGRFSQIRANILAYYPEDLRLHRIASACVHGAQDGQYNLGRQLARGEHLAALAALSRFQDDACRIAYALARRFMPFYKWMPRGLLGLGKTGRAVHADLDRALTAFRTGDAGACTRAVEDVCRALVAEMRAQGLTDSDDPWLLEQAGRVNARVTNDALRTADLMRP